LSTGKTIFFSIFFIEFFPGQKLFFTGRIRSRHFVRMIPERLRKRSDPFSHPSGSSALLTAALVFAFLLYAVFSSSFTPSRPRAQLGAPSPENIQCRAVFIQFIRSVALGPQGPAQSNLLLTHSTVESPLKSRSSALFFAEAGERPHPIRPQGFSPTPFAGLPPLSPNSIS
jgi:hypothetical protein